MSVEPSLTESEEILNDNVDDIVHDIHKVVCDASISNAERCKRVSVLLEEMEEYTQPLIQQIDALSHNAQRLILCRIARIFPEIIQKEIKSVAKIEDTQQASCTNSVLHQNEIEIEQTQSASLLPPTAEVMALTIAGDANEEAQKNSEDLDKVLARLGYCDVNELYRHSKPTQIFGEFINHTLQRKASEKANSKKLDKQLEAWQKEKEQVEQKKLRSLKEERKSVKLSQAAIIDLAEPQTQTKNNAQKVMMMMGGFENEDDVVAICNASSKARKKLI